MVISKRCVCQYFSAMCRSGDLTSAKKKHGIAAFAVDGGNKLCFHSEPERQPAACCQASIFMEECKKWQLFIPIVSCASQAKFWRRKM
jgi:hypothetical protein